MATFKNTIIDSLQAITLPVGNTSQRPSPASAGMMRYNTTEEYVEYYDGSEWKSFYEPPIIGSLETAPADTAKEAYDAGWRGTSVWLNIAGTAYEFAFDTGDRYGTGENGWANYDRTVFANNYTTIPNSTYGLPSSIIPAWNTNSSSSITAATISQGRLRIGREQSHVGGNSLSTVRCAAPLHTSLYYQLTDAEAGGSQTADFGTGWQENNYGYNIFNNNTYQNNGNGYWCIMHSGNASDTSNSTNRRILDPGNLRSQNGPWTTNNYETWGSQLDANYTPYIIWGTTDAYNEYAYIRDWNVWLH